MNSALKVLLLAVLLAVALGRTINELLTASTGRITATITAVNDVFQWQINPSIQASNIQFIFEGLANQQAELRVYDSSASGSLIWNCVSCGTILPPPFFSTAATALVYIKGVSGVSFAQSSFTLSYIVMPSAVSDSLRNLTVNMNMGYGSMQPYQVRGLNAVNAVQRWVVRAAGTGTITFSFSSLTFPSASPTDRLQVFDTTSPAGRLLFDSHDVDHALLSTWLYATSGSALVIFTTTIQTSSSFLLTYYADTSLFNCGSFLQPEQLRGDSLMLSDGSASNELMRRGAACSWLIQPSSNATVSLVMNWVSLKFGGSVTVYDSSQASGFVLWNGQGGTTTVPPIITSSGSSLFVVYLSDQSDAVVYKGFLGAYQSNHALSPGMGAGYTSLAMASALDIVPPGNGQEYTRREYTWYINPSRSVGAISFAFSVLNLTDGDALYVFDGLTKGGNSTLITVYQGTITPTKWLMTKQSTATVVFKPSTALASAELGLFKLSYFTDGSNYHCGFTRNPAVLTMSSWTISDGSSSSEQVYSSQSCVWDLQPEGGNISSIFIAFNRFSLSGGQLVIYSSSPSSGAVYTTISESSAVPAPIRLTGNRFGLAFLSSSRPVGYGFSLTYYGVKDAYSFPGDGIVRLFSASALSLTSVRPNDMLIGPSSNLTWLVSPAARGKIYIALTSISLDCTAQLAIYDGLTAAAPLLAVLCGQQLSRPYKWIVTSSASALLQLTSNINSTTGDYELSYFSDGPAYHCGFLNNPAILTAPSMIFSDGSASIERMYSAQICQWIVRPQVVQDILSPLIVLEFLSMDLQGAELSVYAGSNARGELIWSCSGCSNLPPPLVIRSSSLFLQYTSSSGATGYGFNAIYWTADASILPATDNRVVLQIPNTVEITSALDNSSNAYHFSASSSWSKISFYPVFSSSQLPAGLTAAAYDGRPSQSIYESVQGSDNTCGLVRGAAKPRLIASGLVFVPTQDASVFIKSSIDVKPVYYLNGTTADVPDSGMLKPMKVCKYVLDSGSQQAIVINVQMLKVALNGRLRIFGGVYGNDSVIFDSNNLADRSLMLQRNITVPCGRSVILIENNSTNTSTGAIDYGMSFDFVLSENDDGRICQSYIQSLLPPEKKPDPYIPYYIAAGAVVGLAILIACCVYFCRSKPQKFTLISEADSKKVRKRPSMVTSGYPRYSGTWDQLRNDWFLKPGQCCICKSMVRKVFRLKCGHKICLDDLKGYLESALGDISMFPLKCPMHYETCTGTIDAHVAKRVVTEPQYKRFIEFSDRATYGDGMRCIFCNNYVNFPSDMNHVARVECPYCVQCFCVGCKRPWHYGGRCPLEIVDDSLEDWKKRSGAQKCPSCKKLIEKDDPDTCNHMVHKITDPIPCIRDRTDFCYLCGEEVTMNYPHEEVAHLGVNHFPEGVFQKCRCIIVQEKQAEIDRLKRIKRLKSQNPGASPVRRNSQQVVPVAGDWEELPRTQPGTPAIISSPTRLTNNEAVWMTESQRVQPNASTIVPYDQFDQEWELALTRARSGISPLPNATTSPVATARGGVLAGARGTTIPFTPPGSPGPTRPAGDQAVTNPLNNDAFGSPSQSQRLTGGSTRSTRPATGPLQSPQTQRRTFQARFEPPPTTATR